MEKPLEKSMKILLFGENDTSFESTKLMFLSASEKVLTAYSIEQTEWIICNEKPDMILMDLASQIDKGLSFCSRIRRLTSIPIIVISVFNEPQDIAALLNSGADDFIEKPTSIEMVTARINKLLRRVKVYSPPVTASI